MKRTVQEKYEYNKRRKGLFSSGYCFGVSLYRDYPKQDEEGKMLTKAYINLSSVYAREGQTFLRASCAAIATKRPNVKTTPAIGGNSSLTATPRKG